MYDEIPVEGYPDKTLGYSYQGRLYIYLSLKISIFLEPFTVHAGTVNMTWVTWSCHV